MPEHPYAERIRSFYQAYAQRGVEGAAEFLNEDRFTWHVSGDNPLSGAYHGVDGFRELRRRISDADDWRFEVGDVMVNNGLVLVLFHLAGERKGKRIETEGAHMFRIGDDGRIAEAWGFTRDQEALDEFLS